MNRLIPILLACLCLTACHKGTIGSTNDDSAANDSIVLEKVKHSSLQYRNRIFPYDQVDSVLIRQQSALCDRLFEISFNEVEYTLALVDWRDTSVTDILLQDALYESIDGIALTDSIKIKHHIKSGYQFNDQLLTISRYDMYIAKDYRSRPVLGKSQDTLLIELSEATYSIESDTFAKVSQKDTTLRYYSCWYVKSFFKEWLYNNYLANLYERIINNDSISDEALLRAMPQNKDQFFVYDSETLYPYTDRSLEIDRIAISRAKDNPLLRDAYINMFHWSDGATSKRLYEGYYPTFFYYDSVYFRDAIRRILPEYVDMFEADYIDEETNDIGWLTWVREHKDEILGSQP